ncbi:uncharacterized protein EV154DRAFT_583914 [Mucor mucedo]|uniref:uncharacterized protein n=1 Tax=Mucor mucedo TaxID=29922 RepID=UPI0022204849|nr:uncharacterized protein EV154DRAFT_583914 [Mucor mucedo]KAI7866003.1 hypothetical protein EV154DRAFT_583914 [Mucor mucedo]
MLSYILLDELLCELTHSAFLFLAFPWFWTKFFFFFLWENIIWFFSSSLLAVICDKKQVRVPPEPIGDVYVCFGRGIVPLTTFKNNPELFAQTTPLPVVSPAVAPPPEDSVVRPFSSVPSVATVTKKERKCYSLDCACVVGMPCLSDGSLPAFPSVLPVRSRVPSFAFGCEALTQAWLVNNSASLSCVSPSVALGDVSRSAVAPCLSVSPVAVSSPIGDNASSAVSFPLGDNAIPAVSSSLEDNASFSVATVASVGSGVSGGSPPLPSLTPVPVSSGCSSVRSSPVLSPACSSLAWTSFAPSPVVSSVPTSFGWDSFPASPVLASASASPVCSSAPGSPGLSFGSFALFGVELTPPSSPSPRGTSVASPGTSSPRPVSSPRRPSSPCEEENYRDLKRIRSRV